MRRLRAVRSRSNAPDPLWCAVMRSFTEGCHWDAVSGGGSPSCWQSPVHDLSTITSTITGARCGYIAVVSNGVSLTLC